ncbi:hypothetical protein BKA70DRAFT_1084080, partial [Coprinopsis sp. MPI-PUGE-AT-0042]
KTDVTIHNFAPQDLSPPLASGSRQNNLSQSAGKLVAKGRALVESSATNGLALTDWKSVQLVGDSRWRSSRVNIYEYRYPAPSVPMLGVSRRTVLKEWGSLVSSDEVYCVKDLEEFVHAPFVPRPELAHSSTKRKRAEEQDAKGAESLTSDGKIQSSASKSAQEPPPKRRKLCHGAIFDLIPPPHVHPTALYRATRTEPSAIQEYKRTVPIILRPYTNPLPQPSKHGRRAWIIPLRGQLPWTGTTAGFLLEEQDRPVPPAPRSLEPIFWTRAAIKVFWAYLLGLQRGGRVGAMGFMLHLARTRESSGEVTTGMSSSSPPKEVTAEEAALALSRTDYIKVYHEATKSMFLRTALDLWVYE